MQLCKAYAREYDKSASAALVTDLIWYGPKNMKMFLQRPKEVHRIVVLFYEVNNGHDCEVRQDTNLLRSDQKDY